MRIRFDNSNGRASRLVQASIPPPDLILKAHEVLKRFEKVAKNCGLSFKVTEGITKEAVTLNFWTNSQELFDAWRKEFPDGEDVGFMSR